MLNVLCCVPMLRHMSRHWTVYWEGHRKLKNQGNCYSYIIKRISSNSKTLIEKTSWQLSEGRKTLRVEHFYVWKVKMVCRPIKGKGNFLLNLLLNHEKRPLEFSLSKNYFRKISFILHGSWPATQRWSFLKLGALDILFCQITTFIKVCTLYSLCF